ncbi:hypothetical protein [Salisediminibacterium selenitireducens]|uniref:DUF4352 domain-containing protein n=1 Tax=Bacillus selenitireducens (strain ATCC 700615 / DSM 15326 / MLS10) TaxID=439292 RepID=D6XW00_BACIE|nr:hypothetical protein [Salisediminibacterium selenitireducens]ADH97773.1 hypothetical protein Bsel_0228 [[Bacillus] selenitireducens MLS10]
MKKWMVSLSAATLIMLAACGNDGEDNQEANDNGGNQETQENTAGTNEEAETNDSSENGNSDSNDEWETQVGETIENEGGVFTLHARAEPVDPVETGPVVVEIDQLNVQSGDLSGEMAEFMETDRLEMIQLDLSVANTSDEDIAFYADQAEIATSTGEQLQADFWLSDSIGGEMMGNTSSQGTLFFVLESTSAEEVEHIRIRWSAPQDDNYDSIGEDVDLTVEF